MDSRYPSNDDQKRGGSRYYRRRVCAFCANTWVPDYKNAALLRRFISERGKIVNHVRSGTCAKHQRSLSVEIKRARHLALMPFISKVT